LLRFNVYSNTQNTRAFTCLEVIDSQLGYFSLRLHWFATLHRNLYATGRNESFHMITIDKWTCHFIPWSNSARSICRVARERKQEQNISLAQKNYTFQQITNFWLFLKCKFNHTLYKIKSYMCVCPDTHTHTYTP